MTNLEKVSYWAKDIIPAVFLAEEALQKACPEWKERLRNPKEDVKKLAMEYCYEIAMIIVTQGIDYVPDGSIK